MKIINKNAHNRFHNEKSISNTVCAKHPAKIQDCPVTGHEAQDRNPSGHEQIENLSESDRRLRP